MSGHSKWSTIKRKKGANDGIIYKIKKEKQMLKEGKSLLK